MGEDFGRDRLFFSGSSLQLFVNVGLLASLVSLKLPVIAISSQLKPTANERTPIVFAAYIIACYRRLPTSAFVSRSGHVQRSSYLNFQVLLLQFRF